MRGIGVAYGLAWFILGAVSVDACSSRSGGQQGAGGGGGPGTATGGSGGMTMTTSGAGGGPDCAQFACSRDGCRTLATTFDSPSSWITVTGPIMLSLSPPSVPLRSVAFWQGDISGGQMIELANVDAPPWSFEFRPKINGRYFITAIATGYCNYDGQGSLIVDVQQPGPIGDAFPRLRLVNPPYALDTAQQSASQCQSRQVVAVVDDDHPPLVGVQLFADGEEVARTTVDPAVFQLAQPVSLLSVVATDSAGQQMERSIPLFPDSGPCAPLPVVAIVSPRDGATVRGVVTLTAMSTDPGLTVDFSIDDGTPGGGHDLGPAAGPGFTATWDSSTVPEGDYTLYAFFTDGSIPASDRISIHVAR